MPRLSIEKMTQIYTKTLNVPFRNGTVVSSMEIGRQIGQNELNHVTEVELLGHALKFPGALDEVPPVVYLIFDKPEVFGGFGTVNAPTRNAIPILTFPQYSNGTVTFSGSNTDMTLRAPTRYHQKGTNPPAPKKNFLTPVPQSLKYVLAVDSDSSYTSAATTTNPEFSNYKLVDVAGDSHLILRLTIDTSCEQGAPTDIFQGRGNVFRGMSTNI